MLERIVCELRERKLVDQNPWMHFAELNLVDEKEPIKPGQNFLEQKDWDLHAVRYLERIHWRNFLKLFCWSKKCAGRRC